MKNLLSLLAIVIFSVSLKAQTINVFGKNIRIPNGATATTRNNNTYFGEQIVATGGITRTFSITNTDAFPLSISSITSSSAEFTIGSYPATVASGSSITFSVTFNPSATGVRTASITITNDDFFNPTYIFRVQGEGLTSRTARWVNNAGATRPTSITLNGDSYATFNATYTTVQAAVSAAGNNDIVYITNGLYKNPNEPSSTNCQYIALNNPDNNLRINVNSSSGVIITSETGDYQTSSARLVGYAFNFASTFPSNITIQGLTLDSVRQNAFYNTNSPVSAGVQNIRILRNKITNVRGAGVKTDSWGGDRIDRGMWEINGNYFENIGYYQSGVCTGTVLSSAVWLGDASVSFEISDNTIINTAWAGILCDGFGHPALTSSASAAVTIQRNKIYNTANAGIQIGYSSANNTTVVPTNAFINQNYLENVNTSSSTAVGAITMRQSNLAGVSITHNQITGSWNGIVLNIPGILSKTDSVDCRFNNFCNIKAGSYGFAHQAGVSPNLLNNFSENCRLNKIRNNYWGSSTGPTSTINPGGTGAVLFKSATTTTSGALYSLNSFQFSPFAAAPNVISILAPGTIQGSVNPCSGATYIYSVAPTAGALSYSWALPGGWTGTSTTNTISVTTNTNGGNIVVTTSNSCGATYGSTLSVTIGGAGPVTPLAISGSTSICGSSTNVYTIATVAGASSYTWTLPGGWSGTSTTNTISALANAAGGNISVAATNSCGTGGSTLLAVTIAASPTLNLTGSSSVSCNGGSNGTATVSASGGTSFTYTWAPSGGNAATASGLGANNYTITTTNNCSVTASVTVAISQPASALTISSSSFSNSTGSNGLAGVIVSGGTGSITYSWSPGNPTGQGTASISALAPGNYTSLITDANNCTVSTVFTISSLAPGAALNFDGSNDYVTLPVGIGNAISNGTALTIEYWFKGTDLESNVRIQNGSGYIVAGWGNPIQFIISSDGGTTNGVSMGSNLTLNNNLWHHLACVWKKNTTFAAYLDGVLQGTRTASNVNLPSFSGDNFILGSFLGTSEYMNGSIDEVRIWNRDLCQSEIQNNMNGEIPSSSSGLLANYHFNQGIALANNSTVTTLTDASGNGYTGTLNNFALTSSVSNWVTPGGVTTGSAVSAFSSSISTSIASSSVLCNGGSTGSATVTATGDSPFTYSWSPSGGTSSVAIGLSEGTYTVRVTNVCGTFTNATVSISQPAALGTATATTNVLCFGNSTGAATVIASGGSAPYSYLWSSAQTTSVITGQTSGVRTVTVTDASACTTTAAVNITQPASALASSTAVTNVLCFGNSTGAATLTASGGTSPYTYLWSSAQTTSVISGQTSGARTVTITDANSCTIAATANITQPASALASSTAVTNVLCFGNATGAATLTASGGTSPYSYSWSGAQTNSVISGQTSGVRTVTITDASACTTTNTVTITQPASGISTSTTVLNVLCFGASTGAATLTASGGSAPYSYLWSSAQTTSVITSQTSGVRTVTVTDASACTTTAAVNITQPASALASSTAVTNVLCFGNSTGAATLTASGGTSPYTYLWSSAQTTSVISGQTSGVRTVTLTDANSCTIAATANITQPASALASSTAVTNVLCFGNATGAATLTASGGTSPYTYLWSSAQTTSVISGQTSGVRTVTITDASACTTTNTVTITQPASGISTSTTVLNVLCFGASTGAATLTASGGSAPYSYLWSSAQTTSVITGQTSGVRTVTVTDASACTTTAAVNITQPASALASSTAVTNVLCFGNSTGAATLTASGGTSPYTYLWSSAQTTSVISGQTSGVRTVTLTDANSCTIAATANISQPASALASSTTVTNILCFDNATGAATLTASGGTSPYTYLWSGAQTTSVISGQTSGVRTVTITDANSCTTTNTITIAQPASGISTSTTVLNVLCFGASTGAATLTASGGSSPYTYLWSSAQTTSVISAQTSGVRTVTVTDANSCTSSNTVTITQPASALSSATAVTNILCFGNSTGAASLTASGGTSPYTYLWSSAQTTSVISGQTSGVRTVTITDANSCTIAATANITQPASALASSTAVTNVLCFGNSTGSATLTTSGGTSPYTYLWSSAQTTSVISGQTSGVRTVTITDASACTTTNTVTITQPTAGLVINVSASSPTLCFGNTVTLTATGTGGTGITTYTWVSGPTNSINAVSPITNTDYTVNASDLNNCTATQTVALSVITLPTITVNSGSICSGGSFVIIPNGAMTYTYSGGSATVAPIVSTNYTVTGTSSLGCSNTVGVIASLTVNATPTIAVTNGTICSGQSYTLNPTGANTYTFSGGLSIVSPTTNTSYSITGTSTAGCVSSNTAVLAVVVNTLPIITVNSGSICAGNSFTIIPSGAVSYTYQGGSAVVSPTSSTSYTVSGTSANGCQNVVDAISNVTVFALPTLSLSGGSICPGNNFTLNPSGAASYTYLNGGPIVTPSITTSYSVTGTSSVGCPAANTIVAVVTVTNTLVVGITGSANICSGQAATLIANGASTYSWTSGVTTASASLNPSVNTTYTVFGVSGTCSNNAVMTVTVNTTPTVTIAGNNTLCSGNNMTLTASGANSYSWSTSSTNTAITVSPTASISYSVVGSTTAGCSASTTQAVSVFSVPIITVNSGSICSGNAFTINPTGASTYTYSNGSIVSPSATTNYTVTGTSAQGCTATPVISNVTVNITPTIAVTNGTICSGQSFTLNPIGASTYTYSGGLSIVSPTTNTSYSITGTSTAGCVSNNTAVLAVVVNTLPIITVNSGSICASNSFTIIPSGAVSYTYQGGSAVVSPTSSTSYTVSGTSANGCQNVVDAISNVTVFALPTLSLSGGSICPGNNFTLNPSGAASYTYLNGGSIVTPTITTSYSVTGTSSVGCPAANTIVAVVTVTNTLVVNITGSANICSGQAATLIATGASTYSWTSGVTTASASLNPSVNTTYTVFGVSGTCSNNAVMTVTVNTTPTVTIAGSNTLCSGNNMTLTASGANSYSWNTTATTTSIIVSPTANISYSVVGSTTAGCSASNTQAVSVFSVPIITVNSGSICSGNAFTINPTGASTYTYSNGSIVSPSATTNYTVTGTSAQGCTATPVISNVTVNITPTIAVTNGTICSGQSFTLNPTGANTYTFSGGLSVVSPTTNTSYSITGTSTAGCVSSNTAVLAVVVNTLPIITVNSGSICAGNSFTIIPSGAVSYTYQGGSAVVSPTSSTSYTVSGTSANGCQNVVDAISNVTVFALPTLSLSGGSICPGNNFTLNPSGAASYTYLNGGPIVTPSITTSYSVTGTSSVGCPAANTIVAVVTVTNTLVVTITGSANICSGQAATLIATGASTYSWTSGVTTASASLNPSVNTTYTVFGVSGTCSNNAVMTITVNTTPTVTIAGSNTLCSGNNITLTANGANSYSWSTSSTNTAITVSPTANISYSVVGNTPAGCSASSVRSITVFAIPILTVNSGSICSGNSFTINPIGAFTYTYSSGPVVSPSVNASYSVTGTSTAGCVTNATAVSNVTVNISPTISVSNGTICSGQTFTLNPSGAFSYTYSNGNATVAPTVNQTYSITGTSSLGCVSTNTALSAITVNTLPIIAVSSGSICSGNSYTISPSGAASYSVSGGNFIVSPISNATFVVTGTGANGCVNNTGTSLQVTVNALPTLSISNASICPGNSFTLNPIGGASYIYLNGGPIVTPTVTTSYSITGSSSVGCQASNTVISVVTVSNTLVVTITGSANICTGQFANLTGNGATTYSWSNGALSSTVGLNPLVNTTYTLYGVSGTCSNNAIVNVTVNTTPTINISGSNTLCAGNSVSLIASGANSYSWNTSASSSSIIISPTSNTNFSVVGTTTSGCSNTAAISTTVFVLPTITVNSGTICSGNIFTIIPTGASSFTYSSGSATVNPLVNTNYSVTGSSTAGCLALPVISSVAVNISPTISVNSGSICAGQTFSIIATGANSYTYSSGSATISPSTSTTYVIVGASSLGCVSSNTVTSTVTVIANPTLTVTASSTSVCAGNSSTLNVAGATTYTWNNNANTSSIIATPSIATNYSVVGANSVGCISSMNQLISLFSNPTISIVSNNTAVCAGFNASLTVNGANTYTWNTGSNSASIVVSPSITNTYSVIGADLNDCKATSTINILLNSLPVLTVTAASPGICLGFSTNIVVSGASTYSWNNGATNATLAVSPQTTSDYTVTGISGEGCISTSTITMIVFATPTINIGNDIEIGLGGELQFNPTQSLCVSYSWSPADYLSSNTIINPVVSPLDDIVYTLTVTSINGCKAQDTVNVKVLKELIIANYMSPNNDGVNDTWKVNVPVLIKNFSILIIDSYNQTVYSKDNNYNNEFDGKRNGDELPDGTYYYFIKDGTKVKYKGSITLTK